MTDEQTAAPLPSPVPPPLPPVQRRRGLPVWATVLIIVVAAVLVAGTVYAVLTLGRSAARSLVLNGTPTTHSSSQFGYRVTFPGEPTVTPRTAADGQPAERVQWDAHNGVTVTVEAEKLTTTLDASQLPPVYSSALTAGIKAMSGTNTRDDKNYELDGHPAESELADSTIAGGEVYISVVIVRDVVYSIVITHPTSKLENSINKSFAFTD